MKKYLLFPIVLLAFFLFAPKTFAADTWTKYVKLTVTSTPSVASGTNANFPMLVSSTIAGWAASSSGGIVNNLCTAPNGGQEPCDLIVATATPVQSGNTWSCGTSLNFEPEKYVSSTGNVADWVNVPTMATATTLYFCYGNSTITTDQSHPSSTWNSNYLAVYHLASPTGTLQMNDSTANANTLTNVGAVAATSSGEIDGAAGKFDGSSQYLKTDIAAATSTPLTMEAWINPFTFNSGVALSLLDHNAAGWNGFYMGEGNNTAVFNLTTVSNNFASFDTSGNATATAAGTWNHVVAVTANSASRYTYVDGVPGTQGTGNVTPGAAPSGIGINASVRGGIADNPTNGSTDEVRILNVALSPSWILTEYSNQSAPDAANYSNGFYSLGTETAVPASGGTGEGAILASIYLGTFYLATIF